MPIFATEMAKRFTDTEEVLRMINQRLRKLEKSDSEKTEEIGRLNRIIGQKDKEIHSLKIHLQAGLSLPMPKPILRNWKKTQVSTNRPMTMRIILPAFQENRKRTVATVVSHHLRKVLRHVNCEGRSLCANPAGSRVAVNLVTREAP